MKKRMRGWLTATLTGKYGKYNVIVCRVCL